MAKEKNAENSIRHEIIIDDIPDDVMEILRNIRSKPNYLGPGAWHKLIRRLNNIQK